MAEAGRRTQTNLRLCSLIRPLHSPSSG
jgi:hypothetical protein